MTTTVCPDCGSAVPVDERWVIWCDACGWNLGGTEQREPRGAVGRFLDGAGAVLGRRLAEELKRSEEVKRRLTGATAAAYVLAAVVHLVGVGLIIGAFVLATLTFPNVFALVGAVAMLGFAWLIRPRLGKTPKEGRLERGEHGALYRLSEQVAAALDTGPPDVIVVDEQVNAFWAVAGIRRVRVLGLGLPLLAALEPQERVALIAHELAHGRNGDVRRGLFIGSALTTLSELHQSLVPGESFLTYSSFGILDRFARALLWLLAQPVRGLLLLELHLLMRDMQRAEYLADSLAASVAGTRGVAGLHEKLLLRSVVSMTVQHAARDRVEPSRLFDAIRADIASVPKRERQRQRQVAALERTKLHEAHPPTAMRIDLIESRDALAARVVLADADSDAIDGELERWHEAIGQRIIEQHRASLYF
jgi:Zn-dependent protease with chaperone function